jgi:hypothetical protein
VWYAYETSEVNNNVLNETHTKVRIAKRMSGTFPIQNGMKQEDDFSPLLLNLALGYTNRKIQANQKGQKQNQTNQLLVCADDVNLLERNTHTIKKNTKSLLFASKDTDLEVNVVRTKYIFMSREENAEQNHNIWIDDNLLKVWQNLII